jgi:hypothetical protein
MLNRLIINLVLLAFVLIFATSAFAGWELKDTRGGVTLLSGAKLKTVSFRGETMMYDADPKLITHVNQSQGKYAIGTAKEYCRVFEKMQKDAMENVTEEQKKSIENYRKDLSKKKTIKVFPVGKGGLIAGYKTTKYSVTVDGKLYEEIYIASEAPFFKGKRVKDLLEMFRDFSDCMSERMSNMGMEVIAPSLTKDYQAMMKKGWVMKTVEHEAVQYGGQPQDREVISKISKRSIADSEFSPPKGFEKISIEEFLQLSSSGMSDDSIHSDIEMGRPPAGYDRDEIEKRYNREDRQQAEKQEQPEERYEPEVQEETKKPANKQVESIKKKAFGKLKKLWSR